MGAMWVHVELVGSKLNVTSNGGPLEAIGLLESGKQAFVANQLGAPARPETPETMPKSAPATAAAAVGSRLIARTVA